MFNVVKGFLPWILYSIFYGKTTEQFITAILVALASTIIFNKQEIKNKFILPWVTLIYFAVLLMLTLTFHWVWLQQNTWLFSNMILAGMAYGSFFIKRPFTLQYARMSVDEKFWRTPLFIQINNILTNVWGTIFLLTALVNFIYIKDSNMNQATYIILSNVGWLIGIYCNKKFPPFWKKYKKTRTI